MRKGRRPGPRVRVCPWCSSTGCTHCHCPGYGGCGHAPGEPCHRPRYKRRLVCNPCEKHKLNQKKGRRRSTSQDAAGVSSAPSSSSSSSSSSMSLTASSAGGRATQHAVFAQDGYGLADESTLTLMPEAHATRSPSLDLEELHDLLSGDIGGSIGLAGAPPGGGEPLLGSPVRSNGGALWAHGAQQQAPAVPTASRMWGHMAAVEGQQQRQYMQSGEQQPTYATATTASGSAPMDVVKAEPLARGAAVAVPAAAFAQASSLGTQALQPPHGVVAMPMVAGHGAGAGGAFAEDRLLRPDVIHLNQKFQQVSFGVVPISRRVDRLSYVRAYMEARLRRATPPIQSFVFLSREGAEIDVGQEAEFLAWDHCVAHDWTHHTFGHSVRRHHLFVSVTSASSAAVRAEGPSASRKRQRGPETAGQLREAGEATGRFGSRPPQMKQERRRSHEDMVVASFRNATTEVKHRLAMEILARSDGGDKDKVVPPNPPHG